MSQYAKSLVAAVAAVLVAGVTAWQAVTADGIFRLVDVLPIAVAVASAVLTFLVPNVPELPWAKAAVSGALAALTAMATFVTDHPTEVDVANLVVTGLGALLVWYVPNLGLAVPVAESAVRGAVHDRIDAEGIAAALLQLEDLGEPGQRGVSRPAVDLGPATEPMTAPIRVTAPVEPTPIAVAAAAAVAAMAWTSSTSTDTLPAMDAVRA